MAGHCPGTDLPLCGGANESLQLPDFCTLPVHALQMGRCQAVLTPYLSDKILGLRGLEIGLSLRKPPASKSTCGGLQKLVFFGIQARSDGRWRSPALWAASSSQRDARSSAGGPTAFVKQLFGKDRPVQSCDAGTTTQDLSELIGAYQLKQYQARLLKHLTTFHADSSVSVS